MITRLSPLQLILAALAVVGLAVDAYVHFDVASMYDGNATTTMSQGDLFRIEAVIALVAIAALVAYPKWYTAGFAALVGLGGALLVIISVYTDLPGIGPAPKIYKEPWYAEKAWSAAFEVLAFLAAAALAATLRGILADRSAGPSPRPTPGPAA